MNRFRKATREQLKLRMALVGPTGSGKTYTGLAVAAGLGGRTAVIDSENRSASRYADRFDFDVVELGDFEPQNYIDLIREAEREYDNLLIDSLSHAWMGKGGVLEMVDKAGARAQGNNFAGWRTVTPKHNELVDALIRCRCHLIVTMRAKTEYVIEEDGRGKKVPRKIGMQPVQRDGLEYEFDIVGDMDCENRLVVSKTRWSEIAGAVIDRPGKTLGERLRSWLDAGVPAGPPQPSTNGVRGKIDSETPPTTPPPPLKSKEFEAFTGELAKLVPSPFKTKAEAWAEAVLAAGPGWNAETLKTCQDKGVLDGILAKLRPASPAPAAEPPQEVEVEI